MRIPGRKWYGDHHTLASPKERKGSGLEDFVKHSLHWNGVMDILGLHSNAVGKWMMFTGIVSMIELALHPEKTEKLLCRPTFEPLKMHVHCF